MKDLILWRKGGRRVVRFFFRVLIDRELTIHCRSVSELRFARMSVYFFCLRWWLVMRATRTVGVNKWGALIQNEAKRVNVKMAEKKKEISVG